MFVFSCCKVILLLDALIEVDAIFHNGWTVLDDHRFVIFYGLAHHLGYDAGMLLQSSTVVNAIFMVSRASSTNLTILAMFFQFIPFASLNKLRRSLYTPETSLRHEVKLISHEPNAEEKPLRKSPIFWGMVHSNLVAARSAMNSGSNAFISRKL